MRFSAPLLAGLLVVLTPVYPGSVARADAPPKNWDQLRLAYDSGRTDEALRILMAEPRQDAAYFYNLGTLYYRMSRPGLAVAYLEKAARLNPTPDADIRQNLNLARISLTRLLGQDRLDPAAGLMDSISDFLLPMERRAGLALLLLACLLFSARGYRKLRTFSVWIREPAGIVGVFCALLTPIALLAPNLPGTLPAAIAIEQLQIRSGPGDEFLELSRAEVGMKVRKLGPQARGLLPSRAATPSETTLWHQIRYSGDGIGWVKDSGLLTL